MFNPLKTVGALVGGKVIRPLLRTLAGDSGEEFRRNKELSRKAAVAAVAFARARAKARLAAEASENSSPDNSVNAWQTVMRGRTIKSRGR